MNKNYIQNIAICFYAITSSLLVMYNLLGAKLFRLNTDQWDQSGDGFKNYFNFAYHYNHGEGFYTKGMLYPSGLMIKFLTSDETLKNQAAKTIAERKALFDRKYP